MKPTKFTDPAQDGIDALREENRLRRSVKLLDPIRINKTCRCCQRVFTELPSGARFLEDCDLLGGWYWECTCHSTLFIPAKELPTV